MSGKVYKTTPHIVAFIDILGATNAILKQTDESLEVIHKIYEFAMTAFPGYRRFGFAEPKIKIFSDNIVIAMPCDSICQKINVFYLVATMSAVLQASFLGYGWLTRGGIAAGEFFMDDVMAWGPALVHAYELESHVAYFPRVVVDPTLAKELSLENILQSSEEDKSSKCNEIFYKGRDGLICLEILLNVWENSARSIFKLFDEGLLEKRLAENHGNTKVCQKWRWMAHYLEERRKFFETVRR